MTDIKQYHLVFRYHVNKEDKQVLIDHMVATQQEPLKLIDELVLSKDTGAFEGAPILMRTLDNMIIHVTEYPDAKVSMVKLRESTLTVKITLGDHNPLMAD